ncbi:MAG: hypothetical protein FD125_538 [bacterium]|nr:MAG: hypothetical protein FD125_538 [bacterium]
MSDGHPSLVGQALHQGYAIGDIRRNLLISASLGFVASKVAETSSTFELLGVSLPTELAAGSLCVSTIFFLVQLLAVNFAHIGTFFRPLTIKLDATSAKLKLAKAIADAKTAAQIEEAERIVSDLEKEVSDHAFIVRQLESETRNPMLWILTVLNYGVPFGFGVYVIIELARHFSFSVLLS